MASTKGQRLRKARQSGGLTQQALADRLGVTQPLVAHWESGKTAFSKYREQIETILGPLTNKTQPASAVATSEVSSFGDWVRENKDKAGLSVPELAKKADISTVAIYNILNGKIKNPQSSTRNRLAAAFNADIPSDIVEATEEEQNIEGLGSLTDFNPHEEREWPQCAGIYVLYDNTERPVYVGKGKKIATRLKVHEKQKFWIEPLVTYASYITGVRLICE
jgi:transcriptional regulator with XRE-family HTH domain